MMNRRKNKAPGIFESLKVEKLVHGGQGMTTLPDGRKAFLWNALPGETVSAEVTINKKSFAEGITTQILEPSPQRLQPRDADSYLSTSPWQIMGVEYENEQKGLILGEVMGREGVIIAGKSVVISVSEPGPSKKSSGLRVAARNDTPVAGGEIQVTHTGPDYHYRNKMEYSFWADDEGLSLALFGRGTHRKVVLTGSSIARPEIDAAAAKILECLNDNKVEGRELKTIMLRCQADGKVGANLYVKEEDFELYGFENLISDEIITLNIIYSNPLSPASITTKVLKHYGAEFLEDELLGKKFVYGVDGFWQVKLDVYEVVLQQIQDYLKISKHVVDMYSGVGSIGLSVANKSTRLTLVELDSASEKPALKNIEMNTPLSESKKSKLAKSANPKTSEVDADDKSSVSFVLSRSEQAVEQIVKGCDVIVDPPRAGLDQKVIARLLEVKPAKLVYLSCNPSTQARDLKKLESAYDIVSLTGYNFFPHTPHIESLALLKLKK
jgi:23S rRNA (uracil1939-C5)-methyltransferase